MYFLHDSCDWVMSVHWNYASLIRAKAVVLEHPSQSGACWGLAGLHMCNQRSQCISVDYFTVCTFTEVYIFKG